MEDLPRPIRPDEVAVIRAAIRVGADPDIELDERALQSLESLTVVSRCGCGCPSVDFEVFDRERRPTVLAEAGGDTATPRMVGIIVWGRRDAITGLEVYYYGLGQEDGLLPGLDTIRPD